MKNKYSTYALLETIIVFLLLLLLLLFITINTIEKNEENELEILFEDARMGGRSPAIQAKSTESEQTIATPASASPENLINSEEDAPYIPSAEEEEQRREEAERLKQEELARQERERAEAERKAKEQAAIDKANVLGALLGKNTGSADAKSAEGAGIGDRGNPIGHGSLNGNSWSLEGRDCTALPKPSNNFKQEGKVVINIHVNELGNVVSARVGAGSTISDSQTQELARRAALKAKFSPAESKIQMGTITYIFKLR